MEMSPENSHFRSNWDDPNDTFESALSSMVSSPTSNGGGFISADGMMIRELIGRLGSICESGEISPQSCIATANNTPLNSPPKFNLSPLSPFNYNFANHPPSLAFFNGDPGFAERAAKFSSFVGINNRSGTNSQFENKIRAENGEILGDSREGSSVSEQNPVVGKKQSKKRKSIPKAKINESSFPIPSSPAEDDVMMNPKRIKTDEEKDGKQENPVNSNIKQSKKKNSNNRNNKESEKTEPPKDYIHVRARRGQATDSHSLAERVRREKISERMKFLQDLVPGCNKVTGKATVLDEIINYVQSLQRQVEFLSMKLATVNPRMDFNFDFNKDIQTIYPMDQIQNSVAQAFPFGYQTENPTFQSPSIPGFYDPITQLPCFWEDDLLSIIQNQSQPGSGASNSQMKVER